MSAQPYSIHGEYACFFQGPFSQWYPSPFEDDGIHFCCCEQAMMYRKAELFHDPASMERIMATESPREHKRLGRLVRNFDAKTWAQHNRDIVLRNNLLKFDSSNFFRDLILSSGDLTFVEASPYDTLYGIGRGLDWHSLSDPATWRGRNLLGQILTETRNILREKAAPRPKRPKSQLWLMR